MTPFQQQLAAGRLYSKLEPYRNALAFAQRGIDALLTQVDPDRVYASISFGKQSLCLAHLLYQIAPRLPMYFLASSETWYLHNYLDVIDRFMQQTPITLTIVQTNRLGLEIAGPIADLARRQPGIRWIHRGAYDPAHATWADARAAGHRDLQEMVERAQWDAFFMGLAKEESKGRRITLSLKWPGQPHPSVFRYWDGKYRGCPLMNWRGKDIAAYVATNQLPLLDEYERFGLAARTTARATGMMAESGGLANLRHKNISAFNQLVANFPELRSYT